MTRALALASLVAIAACTPASVATKAAGTGVKATKAVAKKGLRAAF